MTLAMRQNGRPQLRGPGKQRTAPGALHSYHLGIRSHGETHQGLDG